MRRINDSSTIMDGHLDRMGTMMTTTTIGNIPDDRLMRTSLPHQRIRSTASGVSIVIYDNKDIVS